MNQRRARADLPGVTLASAHRVSAVREHLGACARERHRGAGKDGGSREQPVLDGSVPGALQASLAEREGEMRAVPGHGVEVVLDLLGGRTVLGRRVLLQLPSEDPLRVAIKAQANECIADLEIEDARHDALVERTGPRREMRGEDPVLRGQGWIRSTRHAAGKNAGDDRTSIPIDEIRPRSAEGEVGRVPGDVVESGGHRRRALGLERAREGAVVANPVEGEHGAIAGRVEVPSAFKTGHCRES